MASLLTIKQALRVDSSKAKPIAPLAKPDLYAKRRIVVPALGAPSGDAEIRQALHPSVRRGLKHLGIESLFPVQEACIPLIVDSFFSAGDLDFDLCVSVPTGQGKTLSYLIPIVHCLTNRRVPVLKAVVLVPTRDLAKQVAAVASVLCAAAKKTHPPLKVQHVTGQAVFERLHTPPDIVIATAGRFADYVACGNLDLAGLRWLVVDEADRMLSSSSEAGRWLSIVKAQVGPDCQRLLFSATMTKNPQKLDGLGMRRPVFLTTEDNTEGAGVQTISHSFINCKDAKHKLIRLAKLLFSLKPAKCLVFTNSVGKTKEVFKALSQSAERPSSFTVREFDAQLVQTERDQILKEMQSHSDPDASFCLICSDLATRGLDIDSVDLVVNLELPPFLNTYIHRVGRTGRAGKAGLAVSLVERKEADYFRRNIADKFKEKFKTKIAKMQLSLAE